eukprot:PITA_16024
MKLFNTDTSNGLFTWNNKRGGESQVASKLDRFLISEDLMLIGMDMTMIILPFGGSDHWPVQLEVQGIGTPKNKPFRFENIWLTHPDFISNIAKWWTEDLQIQGTGMFLLHKRLKHIKLRLNYWNKNEFGNIFEVKKSVEGKMQELNQAVIADGFYRARNDQATKLHQDWENLCKQEEIFWRQKSRVQWLKEGERNTRFFHRYTMENRSHNRISTIKDSEGKLLNTHKDIEVVLFYHFQSIAKETILDRAHFIRDFTKHIPKLVTREDNYNLNRPVKMRLQDILDVVEVCRMSRTILKVLNTSFISLIPRQDNALTLDRFRPIALCNVVYKIISKVIANRLKPLLPSLISVEKIGYVEGRQILNNIIQMHEVVHSLLSNKKAGMIMKLDLAKASDKLNWNYIKKVLLAFGFDHNWVRWVMALVTSSSFSILVNGSPFKTFKPSRSLGQGDPLSPFLFILMMEGLGRSIKHVKEVGTIQGLRLSETRQALTH